MPAVHAQGAPFKIGLLTVKTGPLAQGGIQMEQGIAAFLKEKGNTLAGRKVELHVRRYRRQSGRRQDQGAGGDRARQGQRHPGAARRLRAARHHRLRARQRHAADQPGRRRGRDPAQGQPVRHPPVRHLGPVQPRRWATTRPRSSSSSASPPSPRTSPSATSRCRRSSACSRTTAARSSRSCGRRW